MKLVMVGVDGSDAAQHALLWAARVAVQADAVLEVATVRPARGRDVQNGRERDLQSVDDLIEREWHDSTEDLGPRPPAVSLEGGGDALLERARDEHADLIVVGRPRLGGLSSLHVGHVARHLLRHAERPFAIVPDEHAEPPGTIVIGADGSPASIAAVRWCADLASDLSAHVVALAAWEPILEWVSPADPRNWRRELEGHLDEWTAPMRDRGVPVETLVAQDTHPAAAITGTADRCSAQLIVVGAHAVGHRGRRLGGVATHLLHDSVRPVVMVPAPS